jgi:hypothetical protein
MFLLSLISGASAWTSIERDFQDAIARVESMVWDSNVQTLAARHGLSAVNVTWEDTGRSKNSSWGPNISDMTIGVRDVSGALHPMPVLRFDNFTDVTGDISPEKLWMRVGNEDGRSLYTVSLADILRSPRSFLHNPQSWAGSTRSLWSSRDSHVIVSAQACFLPIPKQGSATFTPVLYNYQSYPGNPAVLTMTATREGTSMQVIENEGGYLSEVLSFNQNGMRAPFTAMRLSDFQAQGGDATSSGYGNDPGLSVVMIVQVPLKQKAPPVSYWGGYGEDEGMAYPSAPMAAEKSVSDVEVAVVGHGPVEGPFHELNNLAIERDSRFPVRVTVQFYKATSNGAITDADVRAIRAQIDRVYAQADYVGSLVVDGYTARPTEWTPQPTYPTEQATWADSYWNWLKP